MLNEVLGEGSKEKLTSNFGLLKMDQSLVQIQDQSFVSIRADWREKIVRLVGLDDQVRSVAFLKFNAVDDLLV